jgi:hypothetical protein
MRALDYILFITHSFLLIVRKLNNEDIEGRAKNALTIIVFLISLLLSVIIFGLGISVKIISYNKLSIFIWGIALFFVNRFLIFKRYKTRYYKVIETLKIQFSYDNNRVVFTFLILWFIPIFLLWISLIILRHFIYH